jgi:hypothetical protein
MIDPQLIEQLLARDEIDQVLARYFFAVARHDWETVRACFVQGARADYGFEAELTIEAQVEYLSIGIDRFPVSTLLGSNSLVRWVPGGATSETMAFTAHEAPEATGERTRISVVRYDDVWTNASEAWRITDRTLVTLWRGWLDPRRDDRAGDHRYASEW